MTKLKKFWFISLYKIIFVLFSYVFSLRGQNTYSSSKDQIDTKTSIIFSNAQQMKVTRQTLCVNSI